MDRYHMQKNVSGPYLTPYTKINFKKVKENKTKQKMDQRSTHKD